MYRKISLLFVVLLLLLIPISLSQSELRLDYRLGDGYIIINIENGAFSDSIEFYEGYYIEDDEDWQDPRDLLKGSVSLSDIGCNWGSDECDSQPIFFNDVNIFKPGSYYFVVRDNYQNPTRENFYLTFDNLLSCNVRGVAVKHNNCVEEYTNNEGDRPGYCINQEVVNRCAGPKFCRCPSGQICDSSTGECGEPSEESLTKKVDVRQGEEVQVITEELGCDFVGFEWTIGDGMCINTVVPDMFSNVGGTSFAKFCECTLQETDEDNDDYESNIYEGGLDCEDRPLGADGEAGTDDDGEKINPGEVEVCGNSVDENCNGVLNDGCEGMCDTDGDGHNQEGISFSWCGLLNGQPNDDCQDNVKENFPGNVESCEDDIDNNCNGVANEDCFVDEDPVTSININGYSNWGAPVVVMSQDRDYDVMIRAEFTCQEAECGDLVVNWV